MHAPGPGPVSVQPDGGTDRPGSGSHQTQNQLDFHLGLWPLGREKEMSAHKLVF